MKYVSLTLTVPEDLREELEEIADAEDRSLSGQVVNWLKQKVAERSSRNERNASEKPKRKAA